LRKCDGFKGDKQGSGSDFRPKRSCISETEIDRGMFAMEEEYKVVCALSNGADFDDLE